MNNLYNTLSNQEVPNTVLGGKSFWFALYWKDCLHQQLLAKHVINTSQLYKSKRQPLPWSYDGLIYIYLYMCIQTISPLNLEIWFQFMVGYTHEYIPYVIKFVSDLLWFRAANKIIMI